jgi:hypothetical protein
MTTEAGDETPAFFVKLAGGLSEVKQKRGTHGSAT